MRFRRRYQRALWLPALSGALLAAPVVLVATNGSALAQPVRQASHAGQRPLTAAQARALSRNVTDKVIVEFRNQLRGMPDTPADSARRSAAIRSIQRPVLAELAATHARNVHSISLVNAVAAVVSPGEAKRLANRSAVAKVIRDLPIPVAASPSLPEVAKSGQPGAVGPVKVTAGLKPLPNACPAGKTVQLDPEAIVNIHAAQTGKGPATSAQALGFTGAGVKVAWIADGLDPNNPDFIRANGKHVFVDYQDFSGTGTLAPTDGGEAFLDASSIAAQGRNVYNVGTYGTPLSVPCRIRILGVAPGASLVGLNVFGSSNVAFNSVFLEAISYAVTVDHVKVINESFGANNFPDTGSLDLTRLADDQAVAAGVTVVVSSGDAGVTSTIGSPATDPAVLSAGASTTYRAYAQTGIAGITAPGVKTWVDNNISGLSSGGFDQAGGTVDVVAPGDLNWALCTPKPRLFAACTNFAGKPAPVELQGGTSESSPLTAGVAALVIQAYAKTHHGHDPSPAVVKQIIVSTAQDIDAPADQQGAGIVDAYQAVLAAESFKGSTKAPTGHALIDSTTQFNAIGATSATQHLTEKVTNESTSSVTVHLSSRTLSPYTPVSTKTLTLAKSAGYSQELKFTVPPGQARLSVSIALKAGVDLSLIGPGGKFTEFNLPQGAGNYGNAQVADPAAGSWTALIAAFPSGFTAPASFTAHFQASTATWQTFGALSVPALTLAAGATGSFGLTVTLPGQPGDEAGSIVMRTTGSPSFTNVTTVPVTLRAMVPAPDPTTTFTGTLTGGNGRAFNAGQSAYYQVVIPANDPALNAQISTPNANNTFLAELVDPSGEVVSTASNGLMATSPQGFVETVGEKGAQLHVLNPAAGVWTLVIDFFNAVSGTAVSQPFSVTLDDTAVTASQSGLPDSINTFLDAGTPVTIGLTVTNNGNSPEAYFVDARSDSQVTQKLVPLNGSKLLLPNLFGQVPEFLVPSHTSAIKATVSSSKTLFFDMTWLFGDPDLPSSVGKTATSNGVAPDLPDGIWSVTPFLRGPTGQKPAKPVTANVSMTATTAGFNSQFSAPTGDMWLASMNAAAGFTPYVVDPGQTVTIPVTLIPEGNTSQTFSGTIYLADSSLNPGFITTDFLPGAVMTGSDVAAFNYEYTINGP